MTVLLAVSLIANLVIVVAFLRDRQRTEDATRLERTALLQRIQAPEVAVAQNIQRRPGKGWVSQNIQRRPGKGWVSPFSDEEYWKHKEPDAVS